MWTVETQSSLEQGERFPRTARTRFHIMAWFIRQLSFLKNKLIVQEILPALFSLYILLHYTHFFLLYNLWTKRCGTKRERRPGYIYACYTICSIFIQLFDNLGNSSLSPEPSPYRAVEIENTKLREKITAVETERQDAHITNLQQQLSSVKVCLISRVLRG